MIEDNRNISKAEGKALVFLLIAGIILWIPVMQFFMGDPPDFLQDLGFVSGPAGTPLAWILAMVVAVGYSGFTVFNNPLVRTYCCSITWFKLLAVVIAIAAAIVEEAFFRRLVMDGVLKAGGGAVVQVLASGLIFGIAHGLLGIVTGKFYVGLGAMMATGSLGLLLGIIFIIGDRSLLPVIVAHFLITATIQPGIMIAAFLGEMPPPKHGWWRFWK